MGLIAFLVEGQTEEIFLQWLLPYVQLPDRLFVSLRLDEVLNDRLHDNKIWLKNCRGDGAISTYIKKNASAFMRHEFDRLILVRDYYPNTNLCKKELCEKLSDNILPAVKAKYENRIFTNLSVMEIEAWFFADKLMFFQVHPLLTEEYINAQCDNILRQNPEDIKRPCRKLQCIIRKAIPSYMYDKHKDDIHFLVSKLSIDNCFNVIGPDYLQSFDRLIRFLLSVL